MFKLVRSVYDNSDILGNLLVYWFLETVAFIMLPLLVYLITFASLPVEGDSPLDLPEWMFISTILYGDVTKKMILFYKDYQGFNLNAVRSIAIGVVGMVSSSVLIAFLLVEQRVESVTLSPLFNWIQIVVFLNAVIVSAYMSVWMAWVKGEGELLTFMYPESKEV